MTHGKQSIFVFGSNTRGIHGAGAAKDAVAYLGAKWWVGQGRTGNAYAIPTKDYKDRKLTILSLEEIEKNVQEFIRYANEHPDLVFNVTQIGCGYAGYEAWQISPLFRNSPANVKLPKDWETITSE